MIFTRGSDKGHNDEEVSFLSVILINNSLNFCFQGWICYCDIAHNDAISHTWMSFLLFIVRFIVFMVTFLQLYLIIITNYLILTFLLPFL